MSFSRITFAASAASIILIGCGGGEDPKLAQQTAALPKSQVMVASGPTETLASTPTVSTAEANTSGYSNALRVVSGSPSRVTGGSALIGIKLPSGAKQDEIKLWLNGTALPPQSWQEKNGQAVTLISGLTEGRNRLEARHMTKRSARLIGTLLLTNHPISGPVFSGSKLTPFECRTEQSGLGAPLDANCSTARKVEFYYMSTATKKFAPLIDAGSRPADLATTTTSAGATVPFIVRVESGTINRGIYRIAVLDAPSSSNSAWSDAAWNGKLVVTFGENTGAQYNQGVNQAMNALTSTAAQIALGAGYAHIISSQLVNGTNPNDVLSAEGLMMLKEHFIKSFGVPKWTVGYGASGGAIQQLLIAQNYPSLLDGIIPNAAFPDVFGTLQAVSDCRLLNTYFSANPASDSVRSAFEGFAKGTCSNWDKLNGDAIVATGGSGVGCGLNDKTKVFDPVTNPTGARCTIQDVNVATFGRDEQGFARRPLDNRGVPYGLNALRRGEVTVDQFLDVNEKIGGYDINGKVVSERTAGDHAAVRRAYALGRINSGAGGLPLIPIMSARLYAEPAGDIHTAYNDIQIRQKLIDANGQANNHVAWVIPHPQLALLRGGTPADVARLSAQMNQTIAAQFMTMSAWLDAMSADPSPQSPDKVARHKPANAVDACWALDGNRINEPATLNGGQCNTMYPKGISPRMAAGASVRDDVLMCKLVPVQRFDFGNIVFNDEQKSRLQRIFPNGLCDYTQRTTKQVPLKGIWLSYPSDETESHSLTE